MQGSKSVAELSFHFAILSNVHPFTKSHAESIASLGEVALLRNIRAWLGKAAPPPPYGMGDDCAVLPATATSYSNLFAVDALVYGRHFDDSVPPESAGAKLLKRNLSDIAAMGGIPRHAVVSLMLSPDTSIKWLAAFTQGMAACAEQYGVTLVGGDLTETPGFLGGSLSILGFAERPVARTTASVGDWIAVTGALGGSIFRKHHAFTPRMAEGHWLAQQPDVTAMIDVTDGLAKDLPTLLPADSAAAIDRAKVPISEVALTCAQKSGNSAESHAWCDGEDYELLFTISGSAPAETFLTKWQAHFSTPLSIIGRISTQKNGPHTVLDATTGEPFLPTAGYEHFR